MSGAFQSSSMPDSGEPEMADDVCPLCHGVRFVHPLLSSGQPDYARVVACDCAGRDSGGKRQSRLQQYSNLGRLSRLTFASLDADGRSEDAESRRQFRAAVKAAAGFAEKPEGWLCLAGPSGSGKTHLAAAIANLSITEGRPAFYVTTPDLLDHLRASFAPGSETPYDEFFEQVRNAPILVLDDFGTQSGTPWAREKLEQLLNHRYNNRLATVIVLAVAIEELEERVRTRLADRDFCQVHFVGARPSALATTGWAAGFELQKRMTFDTFEIPRTGLQADQRHSLEAAYNAAVEFAESPDGWLVLLGVNGCGKTHLASAIVNYRYQHGEPALFIVVPDFLDHLRSTFGPNSAVSYDRLFEGVRSAELLILDDFGEQSSTPWAQEKLYQVINHRYNARLATVVTTTSTLDALGDRVGSRLADSRISMPINILAPDRRSDATRKKPPPPRRPR
jgi:DNA replication protein DnaC